MATRSASPTRRPTNVTLDPRAVSDARELGINVSKACEAGLLVELKNERDRRWQRDNAATISAWNDWVGKNGLPIEPMF